MTFIYVVKCNISIHGKIIILNIVELSVRTVSGCTMSAAQQRNPLYVRRPPPPGSKRLHQEPQQSTRLQQKRHRLNQSSLPNRQEFSALLVNPPCPPAVPQNHCQLQVFLRKPHSSPASLQDHHLISCFNRRPHLQTLQNPQYPVTVCSNHISESNSDLSAQLLLPQVKI